jgi:hypothetical protein
LQGNHISSPPEGEGGVRGIRSSSLRYPVACCGEVHYLSAPAILHHTTILKHNDYAKKQRNEIGGFCGYIDQPFSGVFLAMII